MHFKILVVFAFTLRICRHLCKATNLYRLFTIIFYWSKATFMVYLKKMIYLLLKVAVLTNTLIMSQTLCGALKQCVNNLFNIERKMCKATKHKQLLLSYKKSKKYRKGMKLRFHLSLCNHDNKLKDVCSKILHKASTGIYDESLKLLRKKLELIEQNVTIIVIISKIKLSKKVIS